MSKPHKSPKHSFLLLLVFLLGLVPQGQGEAATDPPRSVEDATALLYVSDAILAGYTDLEATARNPLLLSPPWNPLKDDPDNASLAAAIQAAKEKRNDLDASCSLLVSRLRSEGKDCEAERVQAACDQKKQGLDAEIGRLHDLRGDRRRPLTKAWHWVKRQGGGFWHRIGSVGRNFLRQVGPEVLQVVASGGSLSGGVLKNILKHQAKAMGRQRLREIVSQGVERLLIGQIEIARAAGVDICDPAKSSAGKTSTDNQGRPSGDTLSLTLTTSQVDFFWHSLLEPRDEFHSCGSLWPDEDEAFKPLDIPIQIDIKNQTITGQVSGSRKIENHKEGDSSPIDSLQNQEFVAKLDGPYQISEPTEGVVLALTGNASLTLTLDGERLCHYWVIPETGDPVLQEYWVTRIETITVQSPYQILVYSPDENTRELTLTMGYDSWGVNNGFFLSTTAKTLTLDELIRIWPE
jgi:hypothetical protein